MSDTAYSYQKSYVVFLMTRWSGESHGSENCDVDDDEHGRDGKCQPPVAEAVARSSLTASSSASLSAIKTVVAIVAIINESDHHDENHNHDKYDHDNHIFSDSHRDCSALLSPTTASPSR